MGDYSTTQMITVFYIQLAIQILPGLVVCGYALWNHFVDNPDTHYVIGHDARDDEEEMPRVQAA